MSAAQFDPFQDGWGEITYEQMAELRRERPVAETPSGFWYLSRHEDCRTAFLHNEIFSNEGGLRGPGVVIPREERMINEMDPPEHTRLRKLERTGLSRKNFRALAPYIRKLAEDLIGALPQGEMVDLVPAVADPIPSRVTSALIGVPVEDSEQFATWSKEVCTSRWITDNCTERGEGLKGAHPEFAGCIDDLVAERRSAANPSDDLVSRLVLTEIDGDRMSDMEIRICLAHLIIGGNGTTTHLLGNLLYRMIESPELYRQLQTDRSRIPAAAEESLRYDAVIQLLTRKCTQDVELSGVRIPEGARVVVGIASANRDEAAFGPDADRFRIDRENPPTQLSFGFGPHLCLGANLARLEAEITINVFLDRFSRAEFAPGFEFTRLPAYWELGPTTLDVQLFE